MRVEVLVGTMKGGRRTEMNPSWVGLDNEAIVVGGGAASFVVIISPSRNCAEEYTGFEGNGNELDERGIATEREDGTNVMKGARVDPGTRGRNDVRKKFLLNSEEIGGGIEKLGDIGES